MGSNNSRVDTLIKKLSVADNNGLTYSDSYNVQGNGMYANVNPYASVVVDRGDLHPNYGVNVAAGTQGGLGSLGVTGHRSVDHNGYNTSSYGVNGNANITENDVINAKLDMVKAHNYNAKMIAAGYTHTGNGWSAGLNADQTDSQYGRSSNVNGNVNYDVGDVGLYTSLGKSTRDGRKPEVNATAGLNYKF